jgi:phosphate transport system substrate-binding protein
VTWLLIKKQYDAPKADAVKRMVSWILTKGQDINKDLGYTRIPANVATKAGQAVTSNVAAR